MHVSNADAVTIYLSEATSFNGFDKSPGLHGKNPSIEAEQIFKKRWQKHMTQLKKDHIADYQSLFTVFNLISIQMLSFLNNRPMNG